MAKEISGHLLSAVVLSMLFAFTCQYPGVEAQPPPWYLHAMSDKMMIGEQPQPLVGEQPVLPHGAEPSPNPTLQELVEAAQTEVVDRRRITLEEFDVGFAVEATFMAPDAGRVSLNLMDETGQNIIIHVDARYNWYSSREVLVLNTLMSGSWGPEQRPPGFDFTPGIPVKVRVEAGPEHFRIFCNCEEVAYYKYRLPADKVKVMELVFQDHHSTQAAELKSLAIFFD